MRDVDEGLMWTEAVQAGPQLHDTSRPIAETLPHPSDERTEERRNEQPLPGKNDGRLDLERLAEEETLRLVYKLFVTPDDRKRRVVLFAGVERDNGCAGICLRAAKMLAAMQPGPVCLVDANLRSPWLHELVGADRRYGLASAGGFGQASVTAFARPLCPNTTNSLWVLPSGSSESDPVTLLTPARVQPRLRELSTRFEHILICAPPADLHAESVALGQAVDGVVLVVSANATRRDAVARVKSRFDDLGIPMLGVVLNDRTYPIPQSLYRLV
jgi:Mrp family chromosome partitioning ATPase